ncbi:MAG TPA: pyridoxamine 5'-phosphate oxidase family protein [Streptosporangiaceae bacterium]|jgi:nitroimidazol reductase NimA-like FMN-containing flavoprotein (pyridoxamine 5'-phosphate oxidase superfamily)|nr:pyridoxamine 5'-phosphate oxidase family protein [Streptosporangiaceae bacterium]
MDPFGTDRTRSTTSQLSATDRTRLGRHRERGLTDRRALHDVLDAGLICHLGVVIDGTPVVLPTGYGRIGETMYLHGSSANRSLGSAADTEVCVTVTLLDGLVCARSVFHNSMNYRSAVIYGTARLVTDDAERMTAIEAITEHLIPGRWSNSRLPNKKEMAATSVLALPLAEASVKVRSGGPSDDDDDYGLDYWAGVLPITMTVGNAQPDPLLRPDIGVPEHISDLQTPSVAVGTSANRLP